MRSFGELIPQRILTVVELTNGSIFGVELTRNGGPLEFICELLPADGDRYMGFGVWDKVEPEVYQAQIRAQGAYRAQYITDPGVWLTERRQNTPDQANNTVNASQRLELGGNG